TECEVLGSFEDDRTSSVLHQLRIRRCLLDDRTVGGEVAAKYRNASHGVDGGGVCSDHLLREGLRGSVQFLTESTAGDGELLRVEQSPKFRQQSWHSAGVVEVFHVVVAGRLEVDQDRCLSTHRVESVQVEAVTESACDGGQVNESVGGASQGEQYPEGVLERAPGEEPVDGEALVSHLHGSGAGDLGVA